MKTAGNPLQDNFNYLPRWIKEAYDNDQTINRIVKDWRMASKPVAALYEKIAITMFEQRNMWMATAESLKNGVHTIDIK